MSPNISADGHNHISRLRGFFPYTLNSPQPPVRKFFGRTEWTFRQILKQMFVQFHHAYCYLILNAICSLSRIAGLNLSM